MMEQVYEHLKTILSLAWESDDMIRQETLFKLQEEAADLALMVGTACGKGNDLVKSFPYLFNMR